MNTSMGSKQAPRRYSPEVKERAVRLVLQLAGRDG